MLLREAHAIPDYDDAFPKLIAAVYPARAALEVMREAAAQGELSVSLADFDQLVNQLVPRWRLVHAVRVRDFHHGGIQSGGRIFIQFRMRLPPHSQAVISLRANPFDPQFRVRMSDSSGSYQLLLSSDIVVQDENEPQAIPYWILLPEYLGQLEAFVPQFVALTRHRE
jgi:hypothetical protein